MGRNQRHRRSKSNGTVAEKLRERGARDCGVPGSGQIACNFGFVDILVLTGGKKGQLISLMRVGERSRVSEQPAK